ncbi:MAG: peptidoglycan D,D-transpeptidase FtsI family protein [Limnobacter sp.]|uniref:peptidoglycan D,D-transpeptidase FtsI family protein n=1 Tax=Limnobacter sp. TaxID=2003368 RepID=UPI0025BFCFB4|nr:penicillin-binding protein 2 [Limnobacter sp.]MDZ4049980.1 penicillin-binding protein 2 [Limnobacter sp.]
MRLPAWRSRFVLVCIFLAFGGLIARAAYLQVISNDFLQEQGAKRLERTLPLQASRGSLLDRNMVVLAQSVPAQAVWYDGRRIVDAKDEDLRKLAAVLGLKPDRMIAQMRKDSKRAFVYLDRQVDSDVAAKAKALKIPGLGFVTESKRYYPQGETMAHLVGFTSIEDKGQEGVELAFNDRLTGEDGERNVLRDRLGNVIEDIRELRPPVNGQDLVLSVDADVQYIVLSELKKAVEQHKAKAAAAVVLDAKTGELLAMANIPTYDPNNRGQLHGEKLRNRVFTDMFEPGSTLKPFGVALAMDQGKVKASTKIDTGNGRMSIGPATISDTKPHGVMTVEEIIQKSSNVGTSKIVLELERKDLWDFFNLLGFGQTPSIAFPGSVAGRVRPWNKWRPIEQATMSYGHGISVSLIQLAQSYTIFANKGHFVPASLIKRGPQDPVVYHRVIGEKVADSMLHMLELASGPEGTAIKAQVQGYRVAGKTGTAHKQEGGRYVNKYVSSYVGLAPVSDPRVIVAIMVDEPKGGVYYGGLVAAPVFSTITKSVLTRLNVQPDAIESTEQLRKFVAAPSAAGSRL